MTQQDVFSPVPEHRAPLRATSGNARMIDRDTKRFDFTKPLQRSKSVTVRRYSPYLKPPSSLKSEPFAQTPASHLENESYLDYLARKRQDRGQDGKPIWSAEVEESFQDALKFIPPIGKNKRCHGGKANGRNELIAKWIEIDTGQIRDRKQISSHIQNLSKKFTKRIHTESGVAMEVVDPDWDALVKPNVEAIHDEEYYWESLEDKVRLVKQLKNQARLQQSQGFTWDQLKCQQHSINRICFSMWVGQLPDMSETLHDYTRISNEPNTLPIISLNEIKSWQTQFPGLDSIMSSPCETPFEILLFKSRVAPMLSFPPSTAKLGLRYDLDFVHVEDQSLSFYHSWSSLTHFYKNGQRLFEPKWRSCNIGETGVIQPGFEVEWWAAQFTNLVQNRQMAEASEHVTDPQIAEEQSRGVFRSLTVMQEIYASPSLDEEPGCLRKRMAVLLWTFGQVHKGHIPLTSWCKVQHKHQADVKLSTTSEIFQPAIADSKFANMSHMWSPTPAAEYFLPDFEPGEAFSPSIFELNPFHTGSTPVQTTNVDVGIFDPTTTIDFGPDDFQNLEDLSTIDPMDCSRLQYNTITHPIPPALQLPSNDFSSARDAATFSQAGDVQHYFPPSSPDRREALANFDIGTHAMLQAQLGPDEDNTPEHDSNHPQTTVETSQQSVTAHVADLDLTVHDLTGDVLGFDHSMLSIEPHSDLEKIALVHPTIFDTPKFKRPPLMGHNSFAGITWVHSTNENELSIDTSMRLDFEKLINNDYEDPSLDDLRNDAEDDQNHFQLGNELIRPQSQPNLTCSNEFDWQNIDLLPNEVEAFVEINIEDIAC